MNPSIETRLESKPIETTLKIQIRKLKSVGPTGMSTTKTDIPFDTGQEFISVNQVLKTPWTELFQKTHTTDTKDLFFTLGFSDIDNPISRQWLAQKVILFDCDKANYERRRDYLDVFAEIAKLPRGFFAATWTGGGIHILVSLKNPIDKKDFFTTHKVAYQIILAKLDAACKKQGLPGTWDPQVFAPQYMSRIPGSINSKYTGNIAKVELLQDSLIDVDFDISKLSGLPQVPAKEMLSKKELAYFKIDTTTVLTGCEFLKYSKQNAAVLSEPEWFAMLGIVSKLQNGSELAHEMSRAHPDYTQENANAKLDYIKRSQLGPRTCESIESMFPGCKDCKFYKKVRSPVQIKGDKFIATRESGFSRATENGKTLFQHHDLMLHFNEENPFAFVPERKKIFVWDGKQWNPRSDSEMKQYAQENYKPADKVSNNTVSEFWGLISRVNVKPFNTFLDTPELNGKLNLQNGVFDIETNELLPHSPHLGFQDTRAFEFIPNAEAPLFSKMIRDVTNNDLQIQNILQEWFGYTVAGVEPFAQKMLICTGEGQNGKSKLLEILAALVGKERFFTTSFSSLQKDHVLANFENKDMLFFDEVPSKGEKATWEFLKSLSSGSAVTGAHKFEKAITFKMKAKIAMTCNTLPHGTDPTHGYFRRLLIVPFNATFSKEAGNLDSTIAERIIRDELPGVLNWAIEGYRRLKSQGWQFSSSKAMDDTLNEYKTNVDSLTRFFKDYLEIGEQMADSTEPLACELSGKWYLDVDALYRKYAEEAEENGGFASGKPGFVMRLKVYLKGLIGGSWVKLDTGDRDYMLVGRSGPAGPDKNANMIILTRRRVSVTRRYLLLGVRLSGEIAPQEH